MVLLSSSEIRVFQYKGINLQKQQQISVLLTVLLSSRGVLSTKE